ncbi:NAD(P)-dependent oxidoreductase [Erwinia aphidicola]|uniref:NAD(P)-dependent oxidoreductase n=1 Tax=Erwinia aphidicola TaxID=68334 RepID=UPI003CE69FD9
MVLSLPDNPATHHIIDEAALANAQLSGAGLDVFWQEPPEPQDALFSHNVIATPHIGGVTDISLADRKRRSAPTVSALAARREFAPVMG